MRNQGVRIFLCLVKFEDSYGGNLLVSDRCGAASFSINKLGLFSALYMFVKLLLYVYKAGRDSILLLG